MKKLYIGVEIGASKHQVVLGDDQGKILAREQGKVVLKDGAPGILEWMKEHVALLIKKAAEFGGEAAAICVGFGGIVETETGLSAFSVQVEGWDKFPVKKWFEETFNLPTAVVNDTVTAGYGEYKLGSGVGSKVFFYTNIGSGIGGVFIVDGKIYDGLGWGAAYFGHTWVPDFTNPTPGAKEKVENMCSGFGIERRLRRDGYIPKDSKIWEMCEGDVSKVNCKMLGDAAKAGDEFALAEIDRTARTYAIGMSNVITLYAPDRVTIGGGVPRMGNILLDPIRKYVAEYVFKPSQDRYTIVYNHHEDDSVPIGALIIAKEMLEGKNNFLAF